MSAQFDRCGPLRAPRADGTPATPQRRGRLALLLNATAGFVDAVGWLSLAHVYTANMTGNTVSMGRGMALLEAGEAAFRGWPILMFVCGLVACALMFEVGRRRGSRRTPALALAIESALLFGFAIAATRAPIPQQPDARFYLLVALPALAMGVQNAMLTRAGALSIRTTHVTGTLSRMADEIAAWIVGLHDLVRHGRERKRARKALVLFALWVCYLGGAVAGVALLARWSEWALAAPATLLAVLCADGVVRPFPPTRAPA
jgi:uncharacterized membrane protein YoaK (UPF0700 family)